MLTIAHGLATVPSTCTIFSLEVRCTGDIVRFTTEAQINTDHKAASSEWMLVDAEGALMEDITKSWG